MRVLLAKELRVLVPIIVLTVVMALMDDVFAMWAEFPDQQPLSTFFDPTEAVPELSIGTAIVSLLLALSLLVRESDEGTLSFLDGLPVTRARVFLAKVLAALAVMTMSVVLEIAGAAGFHALSRDSLEPAFPWRILFTGFGLNWMVGFSCLGCLLALSFLRRWLFLVLGILIWAFVLFAQWRVPHIELFNPLRLGYPAIQQGRWLVPGTHLAVQLALGLAGFAVALTGFEFTGDRTRRLADRLRHSRAGCLLSLIAAVTIPTVWISLLVRAGFEMEKDQRRLAPSDVVEKHDTAHYAFLYRQGRSAEALELIANADSVHAQVAAFLGVGIATQPITVDTTSRLARHNAGQAYWKKIRMLLFSGEKPTENAAVLGHETTHVYIDQLSDLRLEGLFDSARFFHEGVASYVEYRFFRAPDALRKFRLPAAVAHAREAVAFADLARDTEFSRKRARDLVYPLGEIFCAALVKCHGDSAPGQAARAFARHDAPKQLNGATLWRDTLQACGFSLETVLAAWRAELDRIVMEERTFIDSLPRLRVTVTGTPSFIILTPCFDGNAPGKLVCSTRPRAGAAEYEHDAWHAGNDGAIEIPRDQLPRTTFWYQVGWQTDKALLPLFETWVEAAVP